MDAMLASAPDIGLWRALQDSRSTSPSSASRRSGSADLEDIAWVLDRLTACQRVCRRGSGGGSTSRWERSPSAARRVGVEAFADKARATFLTRIDRFPLDPTSPTGRGEGYPPER